MQTVIHLGGKPLTLTTRSFDNEVDCDELCFIDYANLFGEAVTAPALLNQIGLLVAECEKLVSSKKLELESQEASLKQSARKSAVGSGEKITEASLLEKVEVDEGVKVMKKNLINAQFNLSVVKSLHAAVVSKNKKLDVLIYGVTPQELYNELQDGIINNILIKKRKSIVDPK